MAFNPRDLDPSNRPVPQKLTDDPQRMTHMLITSMADLKREPTRDASLDNFANVRARAVYARLVREAGRVHGESGHRTHPLVVNAALGTIKGAHHA